ncbi:MAG: hypothetical protein JRF02_05360 [Deltaproteobacteria bacterium]|jgi:hypothetical protein|nr:hypothetical protein [Deltaproteobacteria bacterium]
MSKKIYLIICAALATFLTGCVTTPTVDSGAVVVESEEFRVAVVFSDSDRRKIREYYRNKGKTLPPGLAKKHPSHPGLRNHIQKHRDLPAGIEGMRLPLELEETLSRLPSEYIRVRIAGDVILLHERTRYVLDVLFDVD